MNTSPPYHHGDLREALLTAAESATVDVVDLSLRQLARETGVSPGAPYKHFATKDLLLRELACRWMGQFVDAQLQAEATASPEDLPASVGTAYVEWAAAHPRRFAWIFDPVNLRDPAPALVDQVERHTALLDRVVAAVEQPSGTTPAQLWATVHGLAVLINLGLLDHAAAAPAIRAAAGPGGTAPVA